MIQGYSSIYKNLINFLNKFKQVIYQYDDEGFSDVEKEYIRKIKTVNPYGLIVLIFGGISFAFGPRFVIFPIITLTIAIFTIGTIDKEKEDNPWTFILGIILSFIGLYMYIVGAVHHLML
ncbi:cell division protein FtsK [Falsibacillus pallidus]|uniref:cell division protein FtsK n=1 Tax=Falsibacillus pallidus TaxID=493781 RepID=UPI003D95C568